MGGKIWGAEEERYFWKVIVPMSVKSQGTMRLAGKGEKSWEECAEKMLANFPPGERRREYTAQSLCKCSHSFKVTGPC